MSGLLELNVFAAKLCSFDVCIKVPFVFKNHSLGHFKFCWHVYTRMFTGVKCLIVHCVVRVFSLVCVRVVTRRLSRVLPVRVHGHTFVCMFAHSALKL